MYQKYFSPDSPERAKVSVHLKAQAKPKTHSAEETKAHALSIVSTILATEKIELDLAELKSIITETAADTGDANAINGHILTSLTNHLSSLSPELPQAKLDAVLDEARAALGLAEVEEKLEHPAETQGPAGQEMGGKDHRTPVLITDVRNWKAGLNLSKGVRPLRDLADFVDSEAKL